NAASLNLIKKFEGFVAKPSPDPVGLPTVGYGHLCKKKGCAEIASKLPLTPASATDLLRSDLVEYAECLGSYISNRVMLNANQWGALVSWTYNEGCGNVESSTLVRRLNSGQNPNTVAAQELPKWKYADGEVLEGLVKRRAAEVSLFQTASSKQAHP
ncbi:glycoside hydrolase family 24 protein, partial [Martensiomyces pterosporus]